MIKIKKYLHEIGAEKQLAFLNPNNFSGKEAENLPIYYSTRVAMITEDNKIILIKTGKNMHTLVGGQVEENEDIFLSLKRECKEESGYDIKDIKILGHIELWKKSYKRIVICFLVATLGNPSSLNLMDAEIKEGHEVFKYSLDESLIILEEDSKKEIPGRLSSLRSLIVLKEAQEYLPT